MSTRRMPAVIKVALACLAVGSVAGLLWLAPLEYATARWLGLPPALAPVVPALIDSYVSLAVLSARDRRWALPIAALSGVVGQLHAAGVLAESSARVRGFVSVLAVLLAVCVTARLKPLAAEIVRSHADGIEAAESARIAADQERTALERAHALETVRLEEAHAQAAREAHAQAAREAHEAEMERTRAAHAHELALAQTRRTPRTEKAAEPERAPRTLPVRTVRAPASEPDRAPVPGPDDLAARRRVRDQWNAREAAGRRTPNAAVARTLELEAAPARALISRWRKERALSAEAGARAEEG